MIEIPHTENIIFFFILSSLFGPFLGALSLFTWLILAKEDGKVFRLICPKFILFWLVNAKLTFFSLIRTVKPRSTVIDMSGGVSGRKFVAIWHFLPPGHDFFKFGTLLPARICGNMTLYTSGTWLFLCLYQRSDLILGHNRFSHWILQNPCSCFRSC